MSCIIVQQWFGSLTRQQLAPRPGRARVVLDFATWAQRDFLFWAACALLLDTETANDLPRIRALMEQYHDLPADFADASLVAVCERRRITTVASIDCDFTFYRMQDRRGFRNLFQTLN